MAILLQIEFKVFNSSGIFVFVKFLEKLFIYCVIEKGNN